MIRLNTWPDQEGIETIAFEPNPTIEERLNTDLIKKGLRRQHSGMLFIAWIEHWPDQEGIETLSCRHASWMLPIETDLIRRDWDQGIASNVKDSKIEHWPDQEGIETRGLLQATPCFDWTLTWSRRDWDMPQCTFVSPVRLNTDLIKKGLRLCVIQLTGIFSWLNTDLIKKGLRLIGLSIFAWVGDWTLTWSRRDWDFPFSW